MHHDVDIFICLSIQKFVERCDNICVNDLSINRNRLDLIKNIEFGVIACILKRYFKNCESFGWSIRSDHMAPTDQPHKLFKIKTITRNVTWVIVNFYLSSNRTTNNWTNRPPTMYTIQFNFAHFQFYFVELVAVNVNTKFSIFHIFNMWLLRWKPPETTIE